MRKVFTGTSKRDWFEGTGKSDKMTGGGGIDYLFGNGGDDILSGGTDYDYLLGGAGHDTLTGGAGKEGDTFFFFSKLEADSDVITDFKPGTGRSTESILFNRDVFSGFDQGEREELFVMGTSAADADTRLIYDRTTGNLYYDEDGIGGIPQVLVVTLANRVTISLDDIGTYTDEGWPF